MKKSMQTTKDSPPQKEREFKSENMVWTRIYYGREVMERILETMMLNGRSINAFSSATR